MHDPLFSPMFSRTYECDPTPGRHVKGGLGIYDLGNSPAEVRYGYAPRGQMDLAFTCTTEIMNVTGSCMFGGFSMPPEALAEQVEAVTGWSLDVIQAGKRIMNMRHAFNLREGQRRGLKVLPGRCVGEPPLTEGPVKGVTVPYRALADYFLEAIDWNKETLVPTRASLEGLGGMEDVVRDLYH